MRSPSNHFTFNRSMFFRMWLVGHQGWSSSWYINAWPNHIIQGNCPHTYNFVQVILESFRPFDDRKCLRDLGNIGLVFLLPIFQSFPLNFKVLDDMIPPNIRSGNFASNSVIIPNKVAGSEQPLLGLGSKDKWRCWNGTAAAIRIRYTASRTS